MSGRLILGTHGTYYGEPDASIWGREIVPGDVWTDVHGNPTHIITSIEERESDPIFGPGEARSARSGEQWGITIEAGRLYGVRYVREALPATVKRIDLFGTVSDTYQTEGQFNGTAKKYGLGPRQGAFEL